MNLGSSIAQKTAEIKAQNPFHGNQALLDLAHGLVKASLSRDIETSLQKAYSSLKTKEERQLFMMIIISVGDIDRQHNLFRRLGIKNVDKGGHAKRNTFIQCLKWLQKNTPDIYYSILPLIPEYTNFENIAYYQLRTDRKKGKVLSDDHYVADATYIDKITTFFAGKINNSSTPAAEHALIAKFLKKPRFSTRKRVTKKGEVRRSKLQQATIAKELFEYKLLEVLSAKCGWEVINYPNNTRFKGFEAYKAKYNRENEDYLFSSKEILAYDEPTFHAWLDKLPAGARFRVQTRLRDKEGKSKGKWIGKYGDLADFYASWFKAKEEASAKARVLEAKGDDITVEERAELKTLQKQAKVTTGAINFEQLFKDFLASTSDVAALNVVADNLLRNITLDVPMLTVVDTSGSMNSRAMDNLTSRINVAALAATIIAAKNPDPEAKNMLCTFNDVATIMVEGNTYETTVSKNRFVKSGVTKKVAKIFDPKLSFFDNYNNIRGLLKANGSTNLTSFVNQVNSWVNEIPAEADLRKEMFNRHQVILVISDGDINSHRSPIQSLLAAKQSLLHATGWDGVLVLWDVHTSASSMKFEFANNVMHIPYLNASTINQVFNNLSDIDIVDSYSMLKALFESNRYSPIKGIIS